MKVFIVGGGLFGAIAGTLVAQDGHEVTIFDDAELWQRPTGSAPAACLIRPSWLGKVQGAGIGLRVLDELYGLRELDFDLWPAGTATVKWVPPREIWKAAKATCTRVQAHVASVGWGELSIEGTRLRGAVLVAAGVWCPKLAPVAVRPLAGVAFTFDGERERPIIKPWAPYKQVVAFTREKGKTWIGDGSTIVENNWSSARRDQSFKRCLAEAPIEHIEEGFNTMLLKEQFGLRPYVKGGGYFRRLEGRTWISTGGAKNGTVLAAYQAWLFREELRRLK